MSLLTLVQSFCRRTNLSVPSTVTGSTDAQVLQIMALLEEEGDELMTRGEWQELTFEATHTTTATENQGDIDTIATNGFNRFKQNTFWDRTEQLPLYVVDATDWQLFKASAITGPNYQIRLRGSSLISVPAPPASNTWAFEYISGNWITDSTGTTYKSAFTSDSDLMLLPEYILKAGLRWRWKKEKGFDYDEDFRIYEGLVSKALSNNKPMRNLNQGETDRGIRPRVVVPDGSWSL